ncbi:hypothetical protein B0H15DRAFT_467342 [Mycena belliarum]|uniref:Uncharacterized protein n=1 Tax=Mycena belliarum TaxID=1033014 RepID=A0AAD6TXX3_9AGAR|nr:hypothetical protein B0H15DRAFT_467342 [Mycena belliae]
MRQMDSVVDPRTARSTSVHSFLLVLCFRRPRSSRGAATEPANKYRRRSIIKLAGRRFAMSSLVHGSGVVGRPGAPVSVAFHVPRSFQTPETSAGILRVPGRRSRRLPRPLPADQKSSRVGVGRRCPTVLYIFETEVPEARLDTSLSSTVCVFSEDSRSDHVYYQRPQLCSLRYLCVIQHIRGPSPVHPQRGINTAISGLSRTTCIDLTISCSLRTKDETTLVNTPRYQTFRSPS